VDKIIVTAVTSNEDNIRVRMFAILKEATGKNDIIIMLPKGGTVDMLKRKMLEEYPCLLSFDGQFMISVNHKAVSGNTIVTTEDEIAALPPVSGG
jgi:molybdopterin converting factor small subunit